MSLLRDNALQLRYLRLKIHHLRHQRLQRRDGGLQRGNARLHLRVQRRGAHSRLHGELRVDHRVELPCVAVERCLELLRSGNHRHPRTCATALVSLRGGGVAREALVAVRALHASRRKPCRHILRALLCELCMARNEIGFRRLGGSAPVADGTFRKVDVIARRAGPVAVDALDRRTIGLERGDSGLLLLLLQGRRLGLRAAVADGAGCEVDVAAG
mmetsp:Transcript_3012/g.5879  ORF Transcript_3012/g.5879 Transcript_3012/m.5879 type:complete len:215 (+) Transcript_3012:271-915(+)